jgi:TonB-dependent SusC/RagA subfamily outer membrane receptor
MRKIFLPAVLFIFSTEQVPAQRKWDKPMKLKNCTIDIKAGQFTATTFIEMDFCNPNNSEIEGLYHFELKPGQVITAFQLDLNGKYRDGSIEEKWKATNAYNSIVGKRIDPALLTMDYTGHYTLRIYPVPAKGCRKVTMTIQELLITEKKNLQYYLPLNINDTVQSFRMNITVNEKPFAKTGLIAERYFTETGGKYTLNWNTENVLLKTPIIFSIPLSGKPEVCTKTNEKQTFFALRLQPSFQQEYAIQPKQVTVFWDASASLGKRDINKEISFLKQFISWHNIAKLTIIPFNYKFLDTAVFYTENAFNSRWQQYLKGLTNDGATQLGIIDLSGINSDIALLFTDGNNTYGKSKPKKGNTVVSCIHTSITANLKSLREIVGASGGKVIDLNKISISTAVGISSRAENWLLNITSASGKTIVEQTMPVKLEETLFINGTMPPGTDTLFFMYGSNGRVNHTEKIAVNSNAECPTSGIDRINMLNNFDYIIRHYSWSNIIDFGLQEKIVTPNTAYIVLERIEDYVKYNIAPPEELKAECEAIDYVKRDTRFERKKTEEASEYEILKNVVKVYNERIKRWDKNEELLYLDKSGYEKFNAQLNDKNLPRDNVAFFNSELSGKMAGLDMRSSALDEVIVTGYGMARRKDLTGSVVRIISQNLFSSATTVEQALQGRLPGLQVTNSSGMPGSAANITIRGISSLSNNQPLYVIDGIPVSGNINDLVNVNDIDFITVLKDHSASALYGSRAANGAIVINTKKWKKSYNRYSTRPYRLKNMEDVEYMQVLKAVSLTDKMAVYEQLKEQYSSEAAFYFDAAQHFFETGLTEKAFDILMNAAEAGNGSGQVLVAIAYILEYWKQYEHVIIIYEQLTKDNTNNLNYRRELAWAHYLSGNYQQSVNILYEAIKLNTGQQDHTTLYLKAQLVNEMNAVISAHKDKLDISGIPPALIKSLPADLRIVIECNKGNLSNASIREPGNIVSNYATPVTKNGGVIQHADYWYYSNPFEYQIKNALKGKYRVSVNYYDYYSHEGKIPAVIRIRAFKNFGKQNQSVTTENIMMDNQYGEIEIAEIKW